MKIFGVIAIFSVTFFCLFVITLYNWLKVLEEIGGQLHNHPIPFLHIIISLLISLGITKFLSSKIWKKKNQSNPFPKE